MILETIESPRRLRPRSKTDLETIVEKLRAAPGGMRMRLE